MIDTQYLSKLSANLSTKGGGYFDTLKQKLMNPYTTEQKQMLGTMIDKTNRSAGEMVMGSLPIGATEKVGAAAARAAAKATEADAVQAGRDLVESGLNKFVNTHSMAQMKYMHLMDEAKGLLGDLQNGYEIHNAIRRGHEILKLISMK